MSEYSERSIEVAVWTAYDEKVNEAQDILVFPPQRDHLCIFADGNEFIDEFAPEAMEFFDSLEEGEFDSVDDAAKAFVDDVMKDWALMGGDDFQVVACRKVAPHIKNRFQLMEFCDALSDRMGLYE